MTKARDGWKWVGWRFMATCSLGIALLGGCNGLGPPPSGSGTGGTGGDGAGGPPAADPLGPESSDAAKGALVIFDDAKVHDARLEISAEDWQSILEDSRGDEFRHAKFYLDGVVIDDVGVRPSGESSRVPGNNKMSMRIQFDAFRPGASLGGYDEIKVSGSWDDPFLVRDRLAYWYLRQMMPAPHEVGATLIVNGSVRGFYEIEEIWSKQSIKQWYPGTYGSLYRLRGTIGSDPYSYVGPDPALYVPLPWDPKGKHEMDGIIPNALSVLNLQPDMMASVIDLNSVMNYFAGNAALANTDGFTGDLEVDDHFQYFDPDTGRLFMLAWDPDNTFGSINDPPDRDLFQNYGKSILTRLIRDDVSLRESYFARLEAYMDKVPVEAVTAEAMRIYDQVRPAVDADTIKQYPTSSFDWSLGYCLDFIAKRYDSVRSQIAKYRAQPPVTPGSSTGTETQPPAPPAGGAS